VGVLAIVSLVAIAIPCTSDRVVNLVTGSGRLNCRNFVTDTTKLTAITIDQSPDFPRPAAL